MSTPPDGRSPGLPRARARVAAMSGYQPGEQPRAGQRVVKLNTNENPYPPSPRVMEALRGAEPDDLRRYPSPAADPFRAAAAALYGVGPDQIIAGNGSDDILTIIIRTFLDAGDTLAYPHPTYSLYPVLAELQAVNVAPVAWQPGYQLPIDALLASGARVIFFANPNAPSGTLVPPAQVAALCRRFPGVVLVDEAYAEFADENCLALLAGCPNLIISRTLSKAYSLAGLRFGYALAAAPLVAEMMKVKDSYNCDALSIRAATAALADRAHAEAGWQKIRAERDRLSGALQALGWTVIPSQTNFIFTRPPRGNAGEIYRALKSHGILVRFFDQPGIDDHLRITIGTPDDNDALRAALAQLPG